MTLRTRKAGSHKGENGRVLVVAGSLDYIGAAHLAAMAAYRSGADWVQVVAPEKVALVLNALSADIVTTKVRGSFFTSAHASAVVKMAEKFDVLLIGNGIGSRSSTKVFAKEVVKKVKGKKVIDADAITAVRLQDVRNAILTPHAGEFEQLLKNSRLTEANYKQKLQDNVLLLKGKIDQIVAAKKSAQNKTGNAGMTVAGTGDVLAGLCAGLLAQGNDLFTAAYEAARINGMAGDLLYKEKGYGYVASELLDKIPQVMRR